MDGLWNQALGSIIASGPVAVVLGIVTWTVWAKYQKTLDKLDKVREDQVALVKDLYSALAKESQDDD